MTGGAAIIACSRDAGAAVRGLSDDHGPSASISRLGAAESRRGCRVEFDRFRHMCRVDLFGDETGSRTSGIDACLHVSCITTLLGDP